MTGRDDKCVPDGDENSPSEDGEERRDWTPEEMEEAEPLPIIEVDDEKTDEQENKD